MYIFERLIFWYSIRPIQRKKSQSGVNVYFLWTKKSKMEATIQYFDNDFLYT
jgi:hypothetical protein